MAAGSRSCCGCWPGSAGRRGSWPGASLLAWSVPEKAAALEGIAAASRAAHLNLVRSPSGEHLSPVGATSVAALLGSRLKVSAGRARADVAAAAATCPDGGTLPRLGVRGRSTPGGTAGPVTAGPAAADTG
jgi:hypothetical protein